MQSQMTKLTKSEYSGKVIDSNDHVCTSLLSKYIKGIQDIRTLFDNCDHNNQFRSNRKSGPWFLSIEEIMAVLNTRIRKCLTF